MRGSILGAVAIAASALVGLSGCATMSEDQCLIGDWGNQGFRDGSEGLPMSRLDAHAKACGKFGVSPLELPYRSARDDGLRTYCRFERGFEEGRHGHAYHGVCEAEEEAEFLPAYHDGQRLHQVEAAFEAAKSELDSAVSRVADREDKLEAKRRELGEDGRTDREKAQIRERIEEVRGELRDARRRAREAELALDQAEQDLDRVHFELSGRYPV